MNLIEQNIFLIFLALVYLIGAIMQDLKRREVDNLWNFSLLVFAFSYRIFSGLDSGEYWVIINGVIGFTITLFLGNLFYYSRVFAGGDAKLLIALGPILPFSFDWIVNVKIFSSFIMLFLITGSIYVFIWSLFLVFKNFNEFKKEFIRSIKHNKKNWVYVIIFETFLLLFVLIVKEISFLSIGLVVIMFPILYSYAKAVEEKCMIVYTPVNKITEGDWLYHDLKFSGIKINSSWEGLSKEEISLIKNKYKKSVLIKQGIPFTPSFLFAFLIVIYFVYRYGWI